MYLSTNAGRLSIVQSQSTIYKCLFFFTSTSSDSSVAYSESVWAFSFSGLSLSSSGFVFLKKYISVLRKNSDLRGGGMVMNPRMIGK